MAHITIDEEKRIFACHGSDNIIELFLVCSDDEVKKRLQKRAKKERRKNGTGLNSCYLKVKILVNIYFGFYGLAECSISRKFYKTHLEVFKSLH